MRSTTADSGGEETVARVWARPVALEGPGGLVLMPCAARKPANLAVASAAGSATRGAGPLAEPSVRPSSAARAVTGGDVGVDPDGVNPRSGEERRVVRQGDLADAAFVQGGGGVRGEVAQICGARGVLACGEGGVAAADEDEFAGVGLQGGAGGEAVVGAERGQRGDSGGDLGGGGGDERLPGAGAVQAGSGGDVDDGGGVPGAEGGVLQQRSEEAGEGLGAGQVGGPWGPAWTAVVAPPSPVRTGGALGAGRGARGRFFPGVRP
ncbi:hypothetical protein GCM10020256_33090 [Streptomyces thermocoprophilus]